MKKVKYAGEQPILLPTLNLLVAKGDVITVPDDFDAEGFTDTPTKTKADK